MIIKMKIFIVSMITMLSTCITWSQGRDINCQAMLCRTDMSRAEYCCSKKHTACCRYVGGAGSGGSGGSGWNNGGHHGNEGSNSGGNWNNGGNGNNEGSHGGSKNNNKPGSCPAYNGKKKRSAEQSQGYKGGFSGNNGGWHNGGNQNGGHQNEGNQNEGNHNGGNHNGGNQNGGNHNGGNQNGGNSNGGFYPGNSNNGHCIRDSECPGSLKCCYLANGYQCIRPQYYGRK